TRPAVGSSRPASTRSSVVFPAPLAPVSASTSPAPTAPEASSRSTLSSRTTATSSKRRSSPTAGPDAGSVVMVPSDRLGAVRAAAGRPRAVRSRWRRHALAMLSDPCEHGGAPSSVPPPCSCRSSGTRAVPRPPWIRAPPGSVSCRPQPLRPHQGRGTAGAQVTKEEPLPVATASVDSPAPQIDDVLTHPVHGPVRIVALRTRTVRGTEREYVDLVVIDDEMQISVPADGKDVVGLRALLGESEIAALIEQLAEPIPAPEKKASWAHRIKSLQMQL